MQIILVEYAVMLFIIYIAILSAFHLEISLRFHSAIRTSIDT